MRLLVFNGSSALPFGTCKLATILAAWLAAPDASQEVPRLAIWCFVARDMPTAVFYEQTVLPR